MTPRKTLSCAVTLRRMVLGQAEQNYAHLEKEGLAVVFGVRKNPPISLWAVIYNLYAYGP